MANKDLDLRKIEETPEADNFKKPEEFEAPARIEVEKETINVPETKPIEKAEEVSTAELLKTAPSAPIVAPKNPTLEKIEDVLEEDLQDIYFQLPPDKRVEFAKKGEETASKIEMLLGHVKIKVSKILELIKRWLKIIPGVNKYFLEQEAKIKTDKILKIKEEGGTFDKNKI